jgi:hypothetical protein
MKTRGPGPERSPVTARRVHTSEKNGISGILFLKVGGYFPGRHSAQSDPARRGTQGRGRMAAKVGFGGLLSATLEATFAEPPCFMKSGQCNRQNTGTNRYKSPVRVIAFNTAEKWSQDVSADVAHELRSRCDLQLRDVPFFLQGFVDQYEGRYHDFQLPLPIRLI